MKYLGKEMSMNKLAIFVAFCTFLMCSCVDSLQENIEIKDNVVTYSVPQTLVAGFADDHTKTYVHDNKHIRWQQGDMISACFGSSANLCYVFDGQDGDACGTFSLDMSGQAPSDSFDKVYAIYPYSKQTSMVEEGVFSVNLPDTQKYAEKSFGQGAGLMTAVSDAIDDEIIYFKNACGFLKLKLYHDSGLAVSSVCVSGNNGEKISGGANVSIVEDGNPVVSMSDDACDYVILDCGEGVELGTSAETATEMWIVLPEGEFSKGITLTIVDTEGRIYQKSTSNAVSVERNMIRPMSALKITDDMLLETTDGPALNEIWYTSIQNDVQGPSDPSSFGARVVSNTYENGIGVMRFDRIIRKIGSYAFAQNSPLDARFKSMILPAGVKTIDLCAFRYSELESVTLPEGLERIEERAFIYCNLEELDIPETVRFIGLQAFDNNSYLKSVTIPDSVTELGEDAFYSCISLETLIIGNGLVEIPAEAFADCNKLASVTIGDSVERIGDYAFQKYTSQSMTVNVGRSVREIGPKAFYGCAGKITFNGDVPDAEYGSPSDEWAWYAAFSELVLADGVETVGDYAFERLSESLKKVHFGRGLKRVGEYAFNGCTAIERVDAPDLSSWFNIEFEGSNSNPTVFARNLYVNGSLLKKLFVPSDVTAIGSMLFIGCDGLETVSVPGNVKNVGSYAFSGCKNLKTVLLGDGVQDVGQSAFNSCSSLTTIELPEGVTAVGSSIFANCSNLLSVSLPETLTSIGAGAFSGCSSLTTIKLPEGVTAVGSSIFANCSKLSSVSLPESLTSIGESAFSQCQRLTSIRIPSSVEYIGSQAFYYCTGLTSLNLPDSVETIGDEAFYYCTSLSSLTLGKNVATIDDEAFYGCTGLASLTLPASVSMIGYAAFDNTGLKTVNVLGLYPASYRDDEDDDWYGFGSQYNLTAIYVPTESLSLYQSKWSEYKSKIVSNGNEPTSETMTFVYTTTDGKAMSFSTLPVKSNTYDNGTGKLVVYGTYERIPEKAFNAQRKLKSIIIPEGVVELGASMFYSCTSLETVDFPKSLLKLGSYAFQTCNALTSIEIPEETTVIASGLLYGCSSLTEINIPESVTEIQSSAFRNCTGLTHVELPKGLVKIEDNVFRGCAAVTEWTLPATLTYIGSYAFYDNTSLTAVYSKAINPPSASRYMFDYSAEDRKIFVPESSFDAYKKASYWSGYKDAIMPYEF